MTLGLSNYIDRFRKEVEYEYKQAIKEQKQSKKKINTPLTAAELVKRITEKAHDGCERSQFHLAVLYFVGGEIEQDWDSALKWIRLSANQGYEPAVSFFNEIFGV